MEAAAGQRARMGWWSHVPAHQRTAFLMMLVFFAVAPAVIYPVFLMKVMCFALFACAFNLLLGYGGLLSFGHAMFLGMGGYVAAYTAKLGLVVGGFKMFGVQIPVLLIKPAGLFGTQK